MFRRRQAFWYMIGGIFLLLAGLVFILGMAFPYALPTVLIVSGAILIIAGALGFRPVFPAFAVFLIGLIALGWAASAPYGFTTYSTMETHELTTAQATAEEASLSCRVSTGNIKLSFTGNATLLYRIMFTKYFTFFSQPRVNFNYALTNKELSINASSTTASVDIVLNKNLRSRMTLTNTTGNVQVEVQPVASNVERMTLATTTGNVGVNITNTAHLENLVVTTTTGAVEAHIKSSFQTKDALVQLTTTKGTVDLNLNVTNIQSFINVTTTTGRVESELTGFTVPSQTRGFQASTLEYGDPRFKKLDIMIITVTGNVDILAQHK